VQHLTDRLTGNQGGERPDHRGLLSLAQRYPGAAWPLRDACHTSIDGPAIPAAWRRLSRDDERLPEVSEAMIRLMLHHAVHPNRKRLPAFMTSKTGF